MIELYFANVGSGKTTQLARIVRKLSKKKKKRYEKIYCNVPIKGTYKIEVKELGFRHIENSLVLIDEGGIEFSNRKKMSEQQIYWFKMHRHYNCDIAIVSQSYEDVDIVIRRLYSKMYLLRKSLIFGFSTMKRINKYIDIDKETGQIVEKYSFAIFGTRRFLRCLNYKLFDSWDRRELSPFKDEKWYD